MEKRELEQVAYCGLCCGDCFAHKGAIADLARDLRKQLRQSRFDKTAEALTEIPFFKALGTTPNATRFSERSSASAADEVAGTAEATPTARSAAAAEGNDLLVAGNAMISVCVVNWTY